MKRENTHEVSLLRISEAKRDIKSRSSISCPQNKSVVQVRYLVVSKSHPIYFFIISYLLLPLLHLRTDRWPGRGGERGEVISVQGPG